MKSLSNEPGLNALDVMSSAQMIHRGSRVPPAFKAPEPPVPTVELLTKLVSGPLFRSVRTNALPVTAFEVSDVAPSKLMLSACKFAKRVVTVVSSKSNELAPKIDMPPAPATVRIAPSRTILLSIAGLMMPSVRLPGESLTETPPVTSNAGVLPPAFEALTVTEFPLLAVRFPAMTTPLAPPRLEPTMLKRALLLVAGAVSIVVPAFTTTPDCAPTPCTERFPRDVNKLAPPKSSTPLAPSEEPFMSIVPARNLLPPVSKTPANWPPDAPATEMVRPPPPSLPGLTVRKLLSSSTP